VKFPDCRKGAVGWALRWTLGWMPIWMLVAGLPPRAVAQQNGPAALPQLKPRPVRPAALWIRPERMSPCFPTQTAKSAV
jgi:hypothetical protein